MARRAWFVESDVPRAADTQNLNFNTTVPLDLALETQAVIFHIVGRDCTGEDVNLISWNVHVIEKRFKHPAAVAMLVVRTHRIIFIEIEGYHAGKIEALFAVQPDQLTVKANRSGTGR